jgi:nickel/cobalt exporter
MSVAVKRKTTVLRSPWLWLGLGLLGVLLAALVFSDGVTELARWSAEYQQRIQRTLTRSLQDVRSGQGTAALWTLIVVCFGYGVAHTLGPGHGKAVVVAYFLDSSKPRAWLEGVFAGSWIAFTHTLAALLLAAALKAFTSIGMLGALREVRNVDIVSYVLILLIGFWRLWAGITGRLHEHPGHDHDHGHDHGHGHGDGHAHDHAHVHDHEHHHQEHAHARRDDKQRTLAGWLLLTAAGIAPCAGALVIILLAVALDVVWAGVVGVLAIAFGMAITLSGIGLASMVAHRLIIGDGRSREIGRFTAIAASLIVIATAGTLLLGAVSRFIR